ncbi:MAG: FtsW/RodA/SpoVE family cell cycle protein [Saprospiraceae bacterium]|uniref:Probable peptidoglycan glycosyltransferase FtsW n=1 Tax=Candidatus Opimibacter skivensis TaxID=2982028 RepID=A0A9D7SRN3_9BACT|nr:FtsW/RodA/SpoVE family cell cycle protein [Candidatus Opimibacter skivensis]
MYRAVAIAKNLKGDKGIWVIVALLCLASVLAVYSSTGTIAFKYNGGHAEIHLIKHMVIAMVGIFLCYVCYNTHYTVYSKLAPILLVISIPLLLYTMLFGPEINDARRWISIPGIGLSFQTSDIAAIALIMYIARSISMKQDVIKDFKSAFLPLMLPIIVVCGLIAPNNLSTALLLFMTCMTLMFIGRVHLKYIFLLVGLGAVFLGGLVLLGMVFPDAIRVSTWTNRVAEFLGNSDGGYQIQQAKIAIADGGWFGVGPGLSTQRNYLPYSYADFIYAIICEEYGLLGGLIIIVLFLLLFLKCTSMVTRSPKTFGALLAMGLCLNIVIQAFANIAVSVNIVPVTGLTLPLVSKGGTSMLITCIAFGMILSVSRFIEQSANDVGKVEIKPLDEDHH